MKNTPAGSVTIVAEDGVKYVLTPMLELVPVRKKQESSEELAHLFS